MRTDRVMQYAADKIGYRVTPETSTETQRVVSRLIRDGLAEIKTRWATLPEWDGGFLGYHYAQSVRIDTLHLTPKGKEVWLRGY